MCWAIGRFCVFPVSFLEPSTSCCRQEYECEFLRDSPQLCNELLRMTCLSALGLIISDLYAACQWWLCPGSVYLELYFTEFSPLLGSGMIWPQEKFSEICKVKVKQHAWMFLTGGCWIRLCITLCHNGSTVSLYDHEAAAQPTALTASSLFPPLASLTPQTDAQFALWCDANYQLLFQDVHITDVKVRSHEGPVCGSSSPPGL